MKKFGTVIYVVSGITGVLCFIGFAIQVVGNHGAPGPLLAPCFIGFGISALINGAAKSSFRRASEESFYELQQQFMAIADEQERREMENQTAQQAEFSRWCTEESLRASEEAMRAAEEARLAATGIEFGGYNPDPNLNPGMQSAMHDFSSQSFGMF